MNLPGPETTDWGTLYNTAINQLEAMINSKTGDITALQTLVGQLQTALSEINMDAQYIDYDGTPLSDVIHQLLHTFNQAITPGTKAKITYDANGLVTGGADLIESDIPELNISKISGLANQISSLQSLIQGLSPDLSAVTILAAFQSSRNGLYIKCSTNPLSAVYQWFVEVRNPSNAVVEAINSSSSNILIDGDSLNDNEVYTIRVSIKSANSSWYSETFSHRYVSASIEVDDIIAALIANNSAMTLFANTLAGSNILAQKIAEANQSSK